MVVTPEMSTATARRMNDDHVSYDEERTYREAIKSLRSAEHEVYTERLMSLDIRVKGLAEAIKTRLDAMDTAQIILAENDNKMIIRTAEAVLGAKVEAQTANDALQRLLEAAMMANNKLADVRFDSQESAIIKTETAITTAERSAQNAIDAARNSAAAALTEVDAKSAMRQEAALAAVKSAEQTVSERLVALQQLINLRATMNDDAVSKATDANEKRFESVNEFRAQLSDQTRMFVTSPVLDARMMQISTQTDTLDRQLRIDTVGLKESIAQLSTRVERREAAELGKREVRSDGHVTIGSVVGIIGGAVGVLGLVATLIFSVGAHNPPAVALNPNIGADTRRVDDLVSRLNELTARITLPGPGPTQQQPVRP